ncbi:HD domain-containing protein [Sulfitobacter sp. R18_1]|uniref:HD domain-containing protein n=1 Tax=Sulfitobacter sp. R18_1 TaxID=2821104 RepID=UPI001ADA9715|nr:HD domain-containing protein [Sulfitobacter sp. R18_1]MBO9428377.1 hypothetical protein [Sulfitobacter sp. R18_1]
MEDKLEEALRLPLAGKPQRKLLLRVYNNFTTSDFIRCVEFLIDNNFSWVTEPEREAAKEISRLAISTMRGNLYHSPEHAFHVAFVALILAQEYQSVVLSSKLKFLLFIGALGHDIGHDGRMDSSGSFDLETRSADLVVEAMRKHGFSQEDILLVRTLILATCAPHRRLIMRLVDAVEMDALDIVSPLLKIPEQLSMLRDNKTLISMCGILSDADLFFSVALGKDASFEQSERVFAEADAWQGHESSLSMLARRQAFFRYVVTGNFASPSGVKFSPSLEQLWGDAFGENLSLSSTSFSRRARYLGREDREFLRKSIFCWAGGFNGFKECVVESVHGHMILRRGKQAFAMTRSGLILEGCIDQGNFKGNSYLGAMGG